MEICHEDEERKAKKRNKMFDMISDDSDVGVIHHYCINYTTIMVYHPPHEHHLPESQLNCGVFSN